MGDLLWQKLQGLLTTSVATAVGAPWCDQVSSPSLLLTPLLLEVFDRWFKWHQLDDQPCLGGDSHLGGDFVFQLEEKQE